MILLFQGASCSLCTCHSIHTWPYFTWLFCYSHWYLICQLILPSDLWFIDSSALFILPLLSYFHIIITSSRVCTCWSASDGLWFFSIRAWVDRRATVWRNPGRLWGVSLTFLISCILAFCLVMMSWCQNCIFFYFCFAMFPILYPYKDYCRCMSFMWHETSGCLFVYVCENLAHLLQRKYSLKRFSSSWVSGSHHHVLVFCILGSRAWHDFIGVRARFILTRTI